MHSDLRSSQPQAVVHSKNSSVKFPVLSSLELTGDNVRVDKNACNTGGVKICHKGRCGAEFNLLELIKNAPNTRGVKM